MNLNTKIECLIKLGIIFQNVCSESENQNDELCEYCNILKNTISQTENTNPWFTKFNIEYALRSWSEALTTENLQLWLHPYNQNLFHKKKKIGVIMAGNIPMVGFHDMLSVLITGNIFVGKLSSKDDLMLKSISEILISMNPDFQTLIFWEENKLAGIDAVIATGSNNTARYFEYYFGKYPNIIRKNRNSIAILSGNEKPDDFKALAEDMFVYFGLGCRNVSKLMVPDNYVFNTFFESIEHWNHIANHHKYANNYEYNRAINLINLSPHLDNGFLLIKESTDIASPISVMFYEYYKDFENLKERINFDLDKIQCVVGNQKVMENQVSFGNSQKPELWDYADGKNTIEFILNL